MESEINLNPESEKTSPTEREFQLPEGASCVRLRLEVPPGVRLTVELEAVSPEGRLLDRRSLTLGEGLAVPTQPVRPADQPASRFSEVLAGAPGLVRSLVRPISAVSTASLAAWLGWLSLGLYVLVRLVGLPSFPIYFFTDEAVQTVLAADFLRDGLRIGQGEILPTFFQNGAQYNLSTSVYLQVLPYFFFGQSIWITRGAAALVTLIAASSVGLILKNVLKSPHPWLAVLFLSVTPVWFLHSRTAFETALAATFYAAFLYFYLMYRDGRARHLFGAVIAGGLAFYSYSPARVVMLVTALLLFISDIRYHWQQRKIVLAGFGLALLLALPYFRFQVLHPEANALQMRLLGSAWTMDIPFWEKVDLTLEEYLHGLSPLYWYLPHTLDLPRHTMSGYGHLLRPTLPLGLLGVGIALRYIRQPAYRTLLIAILAAPAGAALVRLGVTRALTMVIPMAILTALAVSVILEWIRRRWNTPAHLLSLAAFILLAAANLFMLGDSLRNGSLWFREYGLTGMQYGARQVFGEIACYLEERPGTQIVLSPSWANGTDVVARFFFPDPLPFELGSAEGYYSTARSLAEDQLFVMIPEEFVDLPRHLFSDVTVEKVLLYPDGQPGFLFVRLAYVPDIKEIIARELAERRKPGTQQVEINGEKILLSYTQLDMGEVANLFDQDPYSLVRTYSVNPMQLVFDFPAPRRLESLTLRVGGTATQLTVRAWAEGQPEPVERMRSLEEASMPRDVQIELPALSEVTRLAVEVLNVNDTSEGHVHVWEVTLK